MLLDNERLGLLDTRSIRCRSCGVNLALLERDACKVDLAEKYQENQDCDDAEPAVIIARSCFRVALLPELGRSPENARAGEGVACA